MTNQNVQLIRFMDSWLNSDLIKKKIVQIGLVWTVTDNKNLQKFENGSHFWTSLTLQKVDGFGQTLTHSGGVCLHSNDHNFPVFRAN